MRGKLQIEWRKSKEVLSFVCPEQDLNLHDLAATSS
jgi:hypothetical protein